METIILRTLCVSTIRKTIKEPIVEAGADCVSWNTQISRFEDHHGLEIKIQAQSQVVKRDLQLSRDYACKQSPSSNIPLSAGEHGYYS